MAPCREEPSEQMGQGSASLSVGLGDELIMQPAGTPASSLLHQRLGYKKATESGASQGGGAPRCHSVSRLGGDEEQGRGQERQRFYKQASKSFVKQMTKSISWG